jgi:hypothetical protein
MNCLHNYVVNDTPSFLSQPDRLEIIFEMCNHVSDYRLLRFENYFELLMKFYFIYRLSLMIWVKILKHMQLNLLKSLFFNVKIT